MTPSRLGFYRALELFGLFGQSCTDPKDHFIHKIAFFQHSIEETKALEYLKASALQAIGLPIEYFGPTLVNNSGFDAAARGPRRSHQTVIYKPLLPSKPCGICRQTPQDLLQR